MSATTTTESPPRPWGGYRAGKHNPNPSPPTYQRIPLSAMGEDGEVRSRGNQFRSTLHQGLQASLEEGKISNQAFALGMAMDLKYSNADGSRLLIPSQATLGKLVGRSPRTVRRFLGQLRDAGFIAWHHRTLPPESDGKHRQTSNWYRLRIPEDLREAVAAKRRENREQKRLAGNGRFTPPAGDGRRVATEEEQQASRSAAEALAVRSVDDIAMSPSDVDKELSSADPTALAAELAMLPAKAREAWPASPRWRSHVALRLRSRTAAGTGPP